MSIDCTIAITCLMMLLVGALWTTIAFLFGRLFEQFMKEYGE